MSSNAGTANNFRAIVYGNGNFVALTANSIPLRSSDLMNWEAGTNGVPAGWSLYGIYFGNGLFVACGNDGIILISSDGLNWTNSSVSTASTFKCGTYGNGVFISAGVGEFGMDQVARSTNGTDWTTFRHSMNYYAFCFGGGLLVGVGGSSAQWSSDGTTWTNAYIGSINCESVAFGLGQYVAVGDGGAIFGSTNLTDWTQRNAVVCPISTFVEGNGISVGISGNYAVIYSSEDQTNYTRRRDPGGFLTSLTFGKGLFVTAGSVGILISREGTNWDQASAPSSGAVQGMMFEQNIWVAVSQIIISSEDGSNWVLRVQNPGYLTGMMYGGGRFLGFGWSGALWSSADGTNWINCSFPTGANFTSGVFQNGLFSLYAPAGYLRPPMGLVSKDGIHWFDSSKVGPLLSLEAVDSVVSWKLTLAGEWGRNYLLRGSTDLGDWFDLQTITNLNGVTSVNVSNLPPVSAMFFRTVAQ